MGMVPLAVGHEVAKDKIPAYKSATDLALFSLDTLVTPGKKFRTPLEVQNDLDNASAQTDAAVNVAKNKPPPPPTLDDPRIRLAAEYARRNVLKSGGYRGAFSSPRGDTSLSGLRTPSLVGS